MMKKRGEPLETCGRGEARKYMGFLLLNRMSFMFIYTLKELFFFNHILLIYCLLYYLYYLLPEGEKWNHSIIFIYFFCK